jgi:NADPH-dependent 2,4-dienoyl-CoA reductase/sulfur reductase-like enzyme
MLFGEEYAKVLIDRLGKYNIDIKTGCLVLNINAEKKTFSTIDSRDGLQIISADAVILACGAREMTLAERGWINGARPEKIFYTKHLLDLIDKNDHLPAKRPVIIGSDLVAYAAAAKLKAAGASEAAMIDISRRPQCSLPERIYFRRWSKPKYYGSVGSAEIIGSQRPSAVRLAGGDRIDCDSIVLSGGLVPNSELALLGNLQVELPSRKPVTRQTYKLSEPGFFAAGNMLGGFHGAGWCYLSGLQAARQVAKYLSGPAMR